MQDISTQRSAWSTSIVVTPGEQYKRALLAGIERAPRAQLLQMLQLSPGTSGAELNEALVRWRSSLDFVAAIMDVLKSTTPEGALVEAVRIRDRAAQCRAMQVEHDRIQAELAENKEK